jgi:hypothetical protein
MLAQDQHIRDPPIGPAEACMASTAEPWSEHDASGMTIPLVPVSQIGDRGLGEDVRGASHRAQAVCEVCACVAEGDVSNVAERVGSDADRALRCGRPCGHPCSCVMALFQRFWRWLTAISRAEWLT